MGRRWRWTAVRRRSRRRRWRRAGSGRRPEARRSGSTGRRRRSRCGYGVGMSGEVLLRIGDSAPSLGGRAATPLCPRVQRSAGARSPRRRVGLTVEAEHAAAAFARAGPRSRPPAASTTFVERSRARCRCRDSVARRRASAANMPKIRCACGGRRRRCRCRRPRSASRCSLRDGRHAHTSALDAGRDELRRRWRSGWPAAARTRVGARAPPGSVRRSPARARAAAVGAIRRTSSAVVDALGRSSGVTHARVREQILHERRACARRAVAREREQLARRQRASRRRSATLEQREEAGHRGQRLAQSCETTDAKRSSSALERSSSAVAPHRRASARPRAARAPRTGR